MRLLFITQVVDADDSVLGAYHGWIAEFAKLFERIEVICLKEGSHAFPANVRVHSLGKERRFQKGPQCQQELQFQKAYQSKFTLYGKNPNEENLNRENPEEEKSTLYGKFVYRIQYSFRFLALAWRLRRDYDAVFVHMNQEYVLIAGPLWNMIGKPVYLWRNHYAGSWLTDLAAAFCKNVFCTSRASYTAKYRKTILMPVGVDTGVFKRPSRERRPSEEHGSTAFSRMDVGNTEASRPNVPRTDITRAPHSILSLGRIAPSKNLHVLIEALGLLSARGIDFSADIYGDALPKDASYAKKLSVRVKELDLERIVRFHAGMPNRETPRIYGAHEIFVNCSPAGMFDKPLLEAAACGCRILSTSQDLREEAGESAHTASDASSIASGLGRLMEAFHADDLSGLVSRHSLKKLGERLSCILTESSASPLA